MKKELLSPKGEDLSVVIEFSKKYVLKQHIFTNVPTEYSSIVYINEKAAARLDSTSETNILKYVGKQYKNNNVKLAFVRKNKLPNFDWGFGEIQVKNSKLHEAYRVGAHGKCGIRLVDPIKLIKAFGTTEDIDFEKIISVVKPLIVALGKPLLSKYFADSNVSVFEITSLTNEIRQELIKSLNSEQSIFDLGVSIEELTVNGIHVPDEDIELIRNRINKSAEKNVKNYKRELYPSSEQKSSKETVEEIQNLKEMIKNIESNLQKSMDGKLETIKSMIESAYNEKVQDYFPLYEKAKTEVIKGLKLTTDIMIEKAENDDDYAGVAGLVFSNVENNLINKFKVPHHGKDFYMTIEEFNEFISKLNYESKYPFKPRFIKIKGYEDESIVEMPLEIRFMKAGLDQETAIRVSKDWSLLNKFRHRSEENTQSLNDILNRLGYSKKEYLKYVINLFRKLNLYDRD